MNRGYYTSKIKIIHSDNLLPIAEVDPCHAWTVVGGENKLWTTFAIVV